MPNKTKTVHEKLGISFAEYGALLGTRAMLAGNLIEHTTLNFTNTNKHLFNMGVQCTANDKCGSVHCIGGTMALIMGKTEREAQRYVSVTDECGEPLAPLFYPPDEYDFEKITPKQAVKAIDNFLADGDPKWATILPKSYKR